MKTPFPGMDPYMEHPVLWEGLHARLIVAIANQLQPRLDPRYVTSIEERVFVEGPQRRIPDVWVQRVGDRGLPPRKSEPTADSAVVVEVEDLEIREARVEILDAYSEMKLVAIIEVLSPTNKAPGPGRESYLDKQRETLARDCHLVEIDLLRRGSHVLSIPRWRVEELRPYDYLVCISRWPHRNRFELYPRKLRERLPAVRVPLTEPDADVTLDVQEAFEQVHEEGRYARRVRYEYACEPPLDAADQEWAHERWHAFRAARPDIFPPS